MKYIFLLSGDYIKLAKEEVASLFNTKDLRLTDKILTVDLENNEKFAAKNFKRLALTKSIFKFLFECKINELVKAMENFEWNSLYRNSFCLRIHYFDGNKKNNREKYSEKDLAGCIWRSVKNPKVNLKNPKTLIEIFVLKGRAYCGKLMFRNKGNFESRKAHLRPFQHPSSLHPKLARALVNITGIKENGALLDPFCGTGGFLIEAGLMGIKTIGYDISRNMTNGCRENLKYFKIKKYEIFNDNALKISSKVDYVVTDLPYGLNSNVYLQCGKGSLKRKSNKINLKLKLNEKFSISKIENFYFKFLRNLRKKLERKAVIIFPSFVDCESIIKRAGFGLEKVMQIHVHRGLARKITRIKPN